MQYTTLLLYCFAASIGYWLTLGFYRLYFHPLSKFPGPRLAAFTYGYEFYYDVYKSGRYMFKMKELHKQYGPVLRINPDEIHIADSDFYSEIYHQKAHKTDRVAWYNLDYLGESLPFTLEHELHAHRRASLNNYFSPKSIRALEDRIRDVVSHMVERLQDTVKDGSIIDLRCMYAAMTIDIVSEYSFGKEASTKLMSKPEYGQWWIDMTSNQVPLNNFSRYFKTVYNAFVNMPIWLAVRVAPLFVHFLNWQNDLMSLVKSALAEKDMSKPTGHVTLIHELIESPDLSAYDKSPRRLADEAAILLGAGGDTTAATLSRTTFHLLSNPDVLSTLRRESKEALPDATEVPSLDSIANLPYLNAVVDEGLRISLPVVSRSPRVFRDHALQYKDWTIPPGSNVSQSQYFVHTDPTIFPDPTSFNPDRWLNNPSLHKYQTAFSKGRRMCIGINLAYAELRLGLATVFRNFELELHDTTRKDVEVVHDFFNGMVALDTKGIRVKVLRELE